MVRQLVVHGPRHDRLVMVLVLAGKRHGNEPGQLLLRLRLLVDERRGPARRRRVVLGRHVRGVRRGHRLRREVRGVGGAVSVVRVPVADAGAEAAARAEVRVVAEADVSPVSKGCLNKFNA